MALTNQALRTRRSGDRDQLDEVDRREALAPTREERRWRRRKQILGLLMIPLCAIVVITLGELFFHATVRGKLWKNDAFFFFFIGSVVWFTFAFFRLRTSYIYVFAHEMTHAIATLASFGKIGEMKITEHGGFVETSKSNWFITLAPYLVPLYTVIVFLLFWGSGRLWDLQHEFNLPLYFVSVPFKVAWIFYFWIGFTWSFHISFTFDVVQQWQSDLDINGEFFSMMLIFLSNIAVLGALFIIASPTVSFRMAGNDAWNLVASVFGGIWQVVQWLWNLFSGHHAK